MNNWKFADSTNNAVYRVNEDGSYESCRFSALPEGTLIEPADPVVIQTLEELSPMDKLRDFLQANPDVAAML